MLERFPNQLKRLRKRAGYSQKEVSEFLDLSFSENISRWEKGNVLPSLIHLYQLAALYKIPVSDLYPSVWNVVKDEMNSKIRLHEKKKFIDDVTNITGKSQTLHPIR